jgi:hypothetical protein
MSDRQYLSLAEAQSDERLNDVSSKLTHQTISEAERDIDSYVGAFYEGVHAPATRQSLLVKCNLTSGGAEILGMTFTNGAWAYSTLQIVSGANKGKFFPVSDSTNNNLNFGETNQAIAANENDVLCQVQQLSKFPMLKHVAGTIRYISPEVKEAVVEQLLFSLSKNIKGKTKKSESIGSGYSYSTEDASKDTVVNRIAPKARDILDSYGYNIQTL